MSKTRQEAIQVADEPDQVSTFKAALKAMKNNVQAQNFNQRAKTKNQASKDLPKNYDPQADGKIIKSQQTHFNRSLLGAHSNFDDDKDSRIKGMRLMGFKRQQAEYPDYFAIRNGTNSPDPTSCINLEEKK